ncbi:MAG: hypothetical protein Kow0075_09690 [Salibacteraceae bacterium]
MTSDHRYNIKSFAAEHGSMIHVLRFDNTVLNKSTRGLAQRRQYRALQKDLTSQLLKEILGEDVVVQKSRTGKPLIVNQSTHVSITHTLGYVALLVSPSRTCGIDMEHLERNVSHLAHRFAGKSETRLAAGLRLPEPLFLWCGKECIYKWLDKSGVIFKEDIELLSVRSDHDAINSVWRVNLPEVKSEVAVKSFIFESCIISYTLGQP